MITALILAAGQSKRMGVQKMLLPWGERTVLETVITTLKAAKVEDILVVTGGDRQQVEALVSDSIQTVFNPEYAKGEMLSSVQTGLSNMNPEVEAVLIALGDQPQIQVNSVVLVLDAYRKSGASIAVPSHRMRRGHPWLVARHHWDRILELQPPASMRDFLNAHTEEIRYVEINNDSILKDLDTPEDYLESKP